MMDVRSGLVCVSGEFSIARSVFVGLGRVVVKVVRGTDVQGIRYW